VLKNEVNSQESLIFATGIVQLIITLLLSIGIGFLIFNHFDRLFWLASKDNINKLVWVVFGLFFGLIAVVLYYLIRINGKIET